MSGMFHAWFGTAASSTDACTLQSGKAKCRARAGDSDYPAEGKGQGAVNAVHESAAGAVARSGVL